MLAGGMIVAVFVVYHLLHIYGPLHPSYRQGDVHHNVEAGLSSWPAAMIYLAATTAFCAHLRHGLWSALRSLGAPVRHDRAAARLSLLCALLVGLGFAAPCLAALANILP